MFPGKSVRRETCRICEVKLYEHDGWDCCPCCGTTRRISPGEPARGNCEVHGSWCEHWQYMYFAAVVKRAQCLDGVSVATTADLLPILVREANGRGLRGVSDPG
jgi:uncharacterized Zn finger protein (UPF0148 family)